MKHLPKKKNICASNQDDSFALHSNTDYDSLHPEESIREFLSFARSVKSRYEENERIWEECDEQTQDILHYIEMSDNLNASKGFNVYKKLAKVRRVRRDCKNENELLKPFYNYIISHKEIEGQLSQVQGNCRLIKESIGNMKYRMRTQIVSEDN